MAPAPDGGAASDWPVNDTRTAAKINRGQAVLALTRIGLDWAPTLGGVPGDSRYAARSGSREQPVDEGVGVKRGQIV